MTKNGKCLWIVETLLQAGALSLRELNERWERSALYDNRRIQERTFSRYKEHIANEYAIDIDYSPSTNTYDIVNREEIRDNALYRYLFAAYHIADLNTQTLRHRDRVMMEPIPTGRRVRSIWPPSSMPSTGNGPCGSTTPHTIVRNCRIGSLFRPFCVSSRDAGT